MTIESLKPFCATAEKENPAIKSPFQVGDKLYSTDGRIAVCATADQPAAEAARADQQRVAPRIDALIKANQPTGNAVAIPEITEQFQDCNACKGSGKVAAKVKCLKCDGEGVLKCGECGQDKPCPDCDGAGLTEDTQASAITCAVCGGSGKTRVFGFVEIGTQKFDERYIEKVLGLPGVKIFSAKDVRSPMVFVFDGGTGLLMPLM